MKSIVQISATDRLVGLHFTERTYQRQLARTKHPKWIQPLHFAYDWQMSWNLEQYEPTRRRVQSRTTRYRSWIRRWVRTRTTDIDLGLDGDEAFCNYKYKKGSLRAVCWKSAKKIIIGMVCQQLIFIEWLGVHLLGSPGSIPIIVIRPEESENRCQNLPAALRGEGGSAWKVASADTGV